MYKVFPINGYFSWLYLRIKYKSSNYWCQFLKISEKSDFRCFGLLQNVFQTFQFHERNSVVSVLRRD